MSVQNVLDNIKENNIQCVDFRFVDLLGHAHHITLPAAEVDADTFVNGVAFDGSSIHGFRGIEEFRYGYDARHRICIYRSFHCSPYTERYV